MSDKKVIRVNPAMFVFPTTSQTRKKRGSADPNKPIRIKSERIQTRTMKNNKNRLLKYIREQQEKNYKRFSEQSTLTDVLPTSAKSSSGGGATATADAGFESDFESSLQYLSSVAEKTQNVLSPNYIARHNATLRQLPPSTESLLLGSTLGNSQLNDAVGVDLPDVFSTIQPVATNNPMHLRPPILNAPKYGCLKNGSLPTYRMWKNQTMKHMPSVPQFSGGSVASIPATPISSAITTQHSPFTCEHESSPVNTRTGSCANITISGSGETHPSGGAPKTSAYSSTTPIRFRSDIQGATPQQASQRELIGDTRAHQSFRQNKQRFKKRVKHQKQKRILRRTFRLGKSKHYPNVSVLVSNRTIRNTITTKAQLLKQTPIEEIRKTLIKKGLIKVGTTAPNDVLRKMYESVSLLCGDIQNHNPENLLYNYFNAKDT